MWHKVFFFILVFLTTECKNSDAQSWQPLGSGIQKSIRSLFADTFENKIYTGEQSPTTVHIWDGTFWDSLPSFDASAFVESIIKYNNELYVGGALYSLTDTPYCRGVSIYDANNWEFIQVKEDTANLPDACSAVWKLLIQNNELYCFGMFNSIAGISSFKIAKYDGVNWYPFPSLDSVGGGFGITTAVFYKGELYVGGNFDGGNKLKDIAKFDGTQWTSVGNGFTGTDTWVNHLYIYRDTLIVAGYFQKANGDIGNNIAGWDGNNWIEFGDGVMPSNVWDVIEYGNNLYACGQISYLPDSTPINRMAKWDGQQWKDAGLDFRAEAGGSGTPTSFAIMNNELYIGGSFFTVNGDTVKNIVKYSVNNSLYETPDKRDNINIYPNPVSEKIIIDLNSNYPANFELTNITGRIIFNKIIIQSQEAISTNSINEGIYLYRIIDKNNNETNGKLIIRHH